MQNETLYLLQVLCWWPIIEMNGDCFHDASSQKFFFLINSNISVLHLYMLYILQSDFNSNDIKFIVAGTAVPFAESWRWMFGNSLSHSSIETLVHTPFALYISRTNEAPSQGFIHTSVSPPTTAWIV